MRLVRLQPFGGGTLGLMPSMSTSLAISAIFRWPLAGLPQSKVLSGSGPLAASVAQPSSQAGNSTDSPGLAGYLESSGYRLTACAGADAVEKVPIPAS